VGSWDADWYDRGFGYVSALGGDLLDLVEVGPGQRLLDLGCGTGVLLARLAATGAEVVGIDADPAMVDIARTRVPGAEIAVADGHDFSVEQPVDVIFSNAALHWMTRQSEVIARVWAALKPGGRFVAEMGGAGNVGRIVAALQQVGHEMGRQVTTPWYFPTVAQQSALLEGAGFRVASMEHFSRPTPLTDCRDGVADWVRMFGGHMMAAFEPETHALVLDRVNELTAPELLTEAGWMADYWRLRFVAVRENDP
jgi:trans-aconitate methyltransferase